jgi:leader peptidase (prepilin peptidase)/N-methyltransferase
VIDPLHAIYAFALGACVGSFLNVCITRWPYDQSVVSPPSRCPKCERPIRWFDNIPIASWVVLRGRCRGCGLPISPMYPMIELITALGWLATALHYGPSFVGLRVAVFGTTMFGIAVTDARHYLIPDGFTVFGLVWVFATSVAAVFIGEADPFATPYDALVGACTGAGAIAIAGWLGEVMLKREAMGFGDVTLMAVIGGAVGPLRALVVVFVGALIGAVAFLTVVYPMTRLRAPQTEPQLELAIEKRAREMPQVPFGVFLAPAALVTLLWGERVIDWYIARLGAG